MIDTFIQRHLDTVKVLKGLNGAEKFYVTCFPGDAGAVQVVNSNIWIREIDINNIKFAFQTKQLLNKGQDIADIANGKVTLNSMEGIPLSPEILQACGFEKSEGRFESVLWTNKIRLYEHEANEYSLYAYDDQRVYVSYLHELTNLFRALTATELTVNLDKVKV